MKCVNLVSMVMPLQAPQWTAAYANVLWESHQIALLLNAPLIPSVTLFAPVKKAILDRDVRGVLMVSMVTRLYLGTTVRGVCAVVILILMSMEVATPRQETVTNVSMLQQETSVTAV